MSWYKPLYFSQTPTKAQAESGTGSDTVILGASLCLELQTELNPDQSTVKATPLLGESVTMQGWMLNSWNSLLR